MRFDKQIALISEVKVEDGMGGYEVSNEVVDTVNAFTTPINAEVARREYGIVTKETLKVFTKESLPKDIGSIKYEGSVYNVAVFRDFGRKMKMLVVERDS